MTAMTEATCRRDWESLVEATSVFLLIMLYIWWLRLSHPWSALIILGVIIGAHLAHGESLRWLGFGWRNLRQSFPAVFPWIVATTFALLALGLTLGTVREITVTQAALSILAYVIWGLFQQYLLSGYFVNRLSAYFGKERPRATALAAALLFALAHLPNWFLMAVTFIGGYVCARVYLRYRSLYVLALAHGSVGFFLFLIVPDSVSAHFLVGPRYVLEMYGTYPELLL